MLLSAADPALDVYVGVTYVRSGDTVWATFVFVVLGLSSLLLGFVAWAAAQAGAQRSRETLGVPTVAVKWHALMGMLHLSRIHI